MKTITRVGKIIVLGARRCGKSSTLASMMHSLDSSHPNIRVRCADTRTDDVMRRKIYDLKQIFKSTDQNFTDTVRDTESSMDADINTYNFDITLCKHLTFKVACTDIPGEKLKTDLPVLSELAKDANVIIVAIDTPYLMEKPQSLGISLNYVKNITDLIKAATIETNDIKRLLLVPMKCEKYAHSKNMGEVVSKIQSAYEELIFYWKQKYSNIPAYIVPVQTLGDLEFSKFERVGNSEVAQYKYVGNRNFSPRWCELPMICSLRHMLMLSWENIKSELQPSNTKKKFARFLSNI